MSSCFFSLLPVPAKATPNFSAKLKIFRRKDPCRKKKKGKRLLEFERKKKTTTKIMGKQISGAQKRKKKKEKEEAVKDMERLNLGPSKLWTGLVLHHKDVFVSHVLPKLNETDRFFFAGASGGSWEVLAYAKVLSKLSWNIYEYSSSSTLEFAWNNMEWGERFPCGTVKDQAWFCFQVAGTNKLELLKWAREVKQCEWDEWTIKAASDKGNLEMLKYCFLNGCRFDVRTHRHVILQASSSGRVDIVKYLVEKRKISSCEDKVNCVVSAARHGQLGCLKYLLEKARAPLDRFFYIAYARYDEQPECVNYLREKGCPEPTDEQYATIVEDIEAHQDS